MSEYRRPEHLFCRCTWDDARTTDVNQNFRSAMDMSLLKSRGEALHREELPIYPQNDAERTLLRLYRKYRGHLVNQRAYAERGFAELAKPFARQADADRSDIINLICQ